MLIGGSLAMLAMASGGGMMTNYGWREAQAEEIDAALRASVSASALYMRGDMSAAENQIKARVAGFMRGLLGDITILEDDIAIHHDFSTNRTTIMIEGDATFSYGTLWGTGGAGGSATSLKGEYVIVAYDASQYEFALALDVTPSMDRKPPGWTGTRMDGLKSAVVSISQTVESLSQTNPGIIAVSLVPYSNVVNVADMSGTSQTDDKERYVRMLTGAAYNTQTSRETTEHWVDTFHHYGTGSDMGPLASRSLPDFLAAADWNLHKPGTEDVSAQAPDVGTWSFEGKDFWNGCVMARWGAYWDPAARPANWTPADASNWPAKKSVDGWAPGSTGIADLPLHLSDAPPDESDPNTRFTAYSWPDARINGFADGLLSDIMYKTLDSTYDPTASDYRLPTYENHWHLRAQDRGGSLMCPEAPIVPLTDDLTTLQAVADYETVALPSATAWGQTFLHLGIVWGLRTLSPLWDDVWNTKTAGGEVLPRTPCLDGKEAQGCSLFVTKAIVLISDGGDFVGEPQRGRHSGEFDPDLAIASNPNFSRGRCDSLFNDGAHAAYRDAMLVEDAPTFASHFDVASNSVFTWDGMSDVLDAFQAFHPTLSTRDPTDPLDQLIIVGQRIIWRAAIDDMTPWQLFRGYDDGAPSKTVDATDVLTDPTNNFGLRGRPAQNGHFCRPTSALSAYGRPEDLVRVGDGPPVSDVAPFSLPSWQASASASNLQTPLTERLRGWTRMACDIAGQRGVRIHAVYIGSDSRPQDKAAIARLEDCVDRGYGGNATKDEVHVTPSEQALKAAIENIVDIRRTLRFVEP